MIIQRRMTVTISVISLLTVGIFGGVAIPSTLTITEMLSEIANERAKIEKRYQLRQYIRNAADDVERAKSDLASLRRIFLIEGEELDFIHALERSAAVANVSQEINLEVVNRTKVAEWEWEIPIKIQVDGKFNDTMRYLNEIEHLPYYVLVRGFTVNLPPQFRRGAKRDGTVRANFVGVVYMLTSEAPDFSAADRTGAPLTADADDAS
ncbi:hypothetical protein AMJ57_05165 [Parcubacteria bacterium SG8_24]|nr:MAG: hypothetical protein AMJ57_05165 [Parcubacteria bacterium SG8_24]